MKVQFTFLILLTSNFLFSQKMFENQTTNCPIKFTMEDEEKIIYYEPNDSVMILDLLKGLDIKQTNKLNGYIFIQIMVDTLGNTCCVSYTNKSNLLDKRLNIPGRIQQMSGWKRKAGVLTDQNISALIQLTFTDDEINLIRTGYNRNTGRKPIDTENFLRKPVSMLQDSLINKM